MMPVYFERPGPPGGNPPIATDAGLAAHEADTTNIHGIVDTAALATTAGLAAHEADTTNIHGIADTAALSTTAAVAATYAPLSSPTLTTPSAKTTQDTAVLGSELAAGAWSFTGTCTSSGGGGQFAAGGGTMWQNIAVTNGQAYTLEWTQTGASAGSRNVQIGAVEQQGGIVAYWAANSAYIVANTTGAVALTFTGDATYNGLVTGLTVKAITGPSAAALALQDSGGTVRGGFRAGDLANTSAGLHALRQVTTGGSNTAAGANTSDTHTTGGYNTAAGASALRSNTTGGTNTAAGASAPRSNTTGDSNTAAGYYTIYANTTGGYNNSAGGNALYTNTTGGA